MNATTNNRLFKPSRLSRFSQPFKNLIRKLGFEIVRWPLRGSWDYQIKWLMDARGVDLVIDAGANHGQFALQLRQLGYAGRIVSLEPVPAVFEKLESRMAADPNWQGFNIALGEEEGTLLLNVSKGDQQATSFLEFNEEGPKRHGEPHEVDYQLSVPVKRLDELLVELDPNWSTRRIFLKMDTQGFDALVLNGASGIMDNIEFFQTEIAVSQYYEGMMSFPEAVEFYLKVVSRFTVFTPVAGTRFHRRDRI